MNIFWLYFVLLLAYLVFGMVVALGSQSNDFVEFHGYRGTSYYLLVGVFWLPFMVIALLLMLVAYLTAQIDKVLDKYAKADDEEPKS